MAAGVYTNATHADFAVARYNANGSADTTFGSGGKVTTDIGKKTADDARDMFIQPDGKVVVVGRSDGKLALVRYNANGALDTSFDGDGKVTTTAAALGVPSISSIQSAALQADGRILVTFGISGQGAALARYNANGSLDTSYGSGGVVDLAVAGLGAFISVLADGRCVVSGEDNEYGATLVARLNEDGSLDTSFNGTGTVELPAFYWGR